MSDGVRGLFCERHNPGKGQNYSIRADRGCPSRTMVLLGLLAGILILGACAAPVQAAGVPPGNRILLSWSSLGLGTTYYVQTSTNLSTWTAATNTAATNVSLSYAGNSTRVFRLWASNAPPRSTTLAWNTSVPATGVTGYYIHYGTTTGNYTNRIDAGLSSSGTVPNLRVGVTYYFVMTAYTASGLESAYSNEAAWQSQQSSQSALRLNITPLP